MGINGSDGSASRRELLKLIGVGGAAVALSGVLSPFEAAAADGGTAVYSVPTVAALSTLTGLVGGDRVIVGGYYSDGDGGAKTVWWNASSTKADNGGTVHKHTSYGTGRFEVVHDGRADYRWFGIFSEATPADAAFDAMASDTSITLIEAKSNLLFQKRHTILRSSLTLDFNNFMVYTTGIENWVGDAERSPLFFFKGQTSGSVITRVLAGDMPEYTDVYELPYNSSLSVGDWFVMQCSANPVGAYAKEIQRMVRVTERVSSSSSTGDRYRFDYEPGYTVPAGRTMTYQKVTPVTNITIKNMKFTGNGASYAGVHPVTFEYAVGCNADNIHAVGTYCAVVMRFYNTHYITENSSLSNPPDIDTGGKGYFTQQLYCLYGTVRNCKTSMARHLNDFTASAYMTVQDCQANGDVYGAFITHGQYEHDLTYINNSGLMSFANSGISWGSSAKNIVVKKQTGCNLNGGNYITNLTLEDCHIIYDNNPNLTLAARMNGTIHVNCDGIVMRNCTADRMLYMFANTNLSRRPNVIENCDFQLTYAEAGTTVQPYLTSLSPRIVQAVTFKNTRFSNITSSYFFNNAPVTFENCTFESISSSEGNGVDFRGYRITFYGCRFYNTGIVLRSVAADQTAAANAGELYAGAGMQHLIMRDCEFLGAFSIASIRVHSSATAPVMLDLSGIRFDQDSGYFIKDEASGKLAGLKMSGCTLRAGSTALPTAPLFTNGHCIIAGNYFENHSFTNLPSTKQAANNVAVNTTGI